MPLFESNLSRRRTTAEGVLIMRLGPPTNPRLAPVGNGCATPLSRGDPDGDRFIVALIPEGGASESGPRSQLILVQNFFEELKRLVPN